ncbi:MAG: hypothetical protein WB762_00960 [Candidatus Sulfotelmatobacter sp.]
MNPLERGSEPNAVFKLRFAQFEDGSAFGDPSEAENDLAIRETIVDGLRDLLQSYSKGGEQALVTELRRQSSWSNTSIFSQIRMSYESGGTAAAVAKARQILGVAENHEVAMAHPGAPS